MGGNEVDLLGRHWRAILVDVPSNIHNEEKLHRRVHPHFIRPDGSVSSGAFTDSEMSVDRTGYRSLEDTLDGCPDHGCASLETAFARSLEQEVIAVPELLNPAHAHVSGRKTKSIAKSLARNSTRVI